MAAATAGVERTQVNFRLEGSCMEQDLSTNSYTSGISKQFDELFGGRSSELGIKVFTEFAQVFLSGIDTRLENFSSSLDNEDFRQFQMLAHQLRGSFRTLGAHGLADILQRIEDHIKSTPSPDVHQLGIWREMILGGTPRLVKDLQSFTTSLQSAVS